MKPGHPLGIHRTIEPPGSLPQPAWRVDNDLDDHYASEIHVAVETLNIDAASFRQMEEGPEGPPGVAAAVTRTVAARGKQHNPVTGSGGMLIGTVSWVGPAAEDRGYRIGDRVATLASLSLTPLRLDEVRAVRPESAQLDVRGGAIVFASAPLAILPADLPERLAVSLCDVAGAAPQIARRAHPGDLVVVLGAGGKSGVLCCAEARRSVGAAGTVIGVESAPALAGDVERLGLCDAVIAADARDALAVEQAVMSITAGRAADLVVSCVNVGGAESSAILVTKARGAVYFFAMSTSFTAAALGAEGMAKDIDMYIGNGYAQGHVEHTFELVRASPALLALFTRRYG